MIHFSIGKQIEMPNHPGCDIGSPSSRWTQRCEQDNALNSEQLLIPSIVPHMMIQKLPQEFDWGLCTVLFFFGHVEIIDEENAEILWFGSVLSFSDFIQFPIDDVLGLNS